LARLATFASNLHISCNDALQQVSFLDLFQLPLSVIAYKEYHRFEQFLMSKQGDMRKILGHIFGALPLSWLTLILCSKILMSHLWLSTGFGTLAVKRNTRYFAG
jgi:uncharacterized membrane protein